MPWIRKRLRGAKIWVRCDGSGVPLPGSSGRVEILYQTGGKIYRAGLRNLEPDDDPLILSDEQAAPSGVADAKPARLGPKPAAHRTGLLGNALPGSIHIFTDGACTGNPGPMGIGVVLLDGDKRREISEYLGLGTNNIAELYAILRGLEEAVPDRPVVIYSDSSYALGLLGQGWKAKANQELVGRLRKVAGTFEKLKLVKVAGHAGVVENERCDELAREAILKRG